MRYTIGFARFLPILWLVGFTIAQAQADQASPAPPEKCQNKAYTLETSQGIAGGGNLEYDGNTAIFSDGACLSTKGLELQAPDLRYDQASQTIQAQDIEVQTARYRFWANTGLIGGKVLLAEGLRITTCKCGDNLRLVSQKMRFDTDSGEIILEDSTLEFNRFGLARFARLAFSPEEPLAASLGLASADSNVLALLPVRLDFDQGLNAGVEEFPVPGSGEFSSRFPLRLTLMGLNIGSPQPGFRFGFSVRETGRKARFLVENQFGALNIYTLLRDGPVLFISDTKEQHYAFGLLKSWVIEGFTLSPFGYAAKDQAEQGLSVGAEVKYSVEALQGPFRLRLEPFVVGALHEKPPGYLAYGASIEGRYDADFAFRISYSWSQENIPGRFWIEQREATSLISGSFAYEGLNLQAKYDFLSSETIGSARYSSRQDFGELWVQYDFCVDCYGKITRTDGLQDIERRELQLGFNPNPLNCTEKLSFSPTIGIGYDFGRPGTPGKGLGLTRAGLEVRYADCCFIWKFGYQYIFTPQIPGENVTGKLTLGLEIR